MWDATKVVLRSKFIAVDVYIIKEERSKINNLNFQLRKLEKEQSRSNRQKTNRETKKHRDTCKTTTTTKTQQT